MQRPGCRGPGERTTMAHEQRAVGGREARRRRNPYAGQARETARQMMSKERRNIDNGVRHMTMTDPPTTDGTSVGYGQGTHAGDEPLMKTTHDGRRGPSAAPPCTAHIEAQERARECENEKQRTTKHNDERRRRMTSNGGRRKTQTRYGQPGGNERQETTKNEADKDDKGDENERRHEWRRQAPKLEDRRGLPAAPK